YTKAEDGELAGKFVLDADVSSHPKVTAVKAESIKERKARQTVEAALKAFQDLGLSAEQIAEIKKKAEAGAGGKGDEDFEHKVAKRVQVELDKLKPDLEERDRLKAENRE